MALPKRIKKADFDKLPEALQEHYTEKNGAYVLDVKKADDDDGDDDDDAASAAVRAKNHEKEKRKAAEARVKELEAEAAQRDEDSLRKKGDVDALDKSWRAKHEAELAKKDSSIEGYKAAIRKHLVDNVAVSLAAELTDAPALMLPHITKRLAVDFDGDEPVTRILDAAGKPSASTVADLKKEFLHSPEFSPIIRGSKASGGASGSKTVSRKVSGQTGERKTLAQMDKSEAESHLEALHQQHFGG